MNSHHGSNPGKFIQPGMLLFVALSKNAIHPVVEVVRTWRILPDELDRRWNLVRDRLRAQSLHALIVQRYEEKIDGPVRWLTDIPGGYPRTIIVHAEDLMTMVDHAPQWAVRQLHGSDPTCFGVGDLVTAWLLYGGHFTSGLNAEAGIGALRRGGYTNVGWVGPRALSYGFSADIQDTTDGAACFTDKIDSFDRTKALKSDEELILIRKTAEAILA